MIRQLPSAPQDADALAALIQRMEFALIGPTNAAGTGVTGVTGPMGMPTPTGMTSGQLVGAGA